MNITKRSFYHVLAVSTTLIALCALGCGHRDSVVGTWSGTSPVTNGGPAAAVTYEFGADGLEQFSGVIPPHPPAKPASFASIAIDNITNVHSAGKYTIKGDVMTISTTQIAMRDAHGQPPPFPFSLSADSKPKTLRYSVRGDTLTLDTLDGTPPIVLTRLKA